MGGQPSKEQFLYEQAVQGKFRSLQALRNRGADLEWTDEHGKTALIIACSRQDLFKVAETLIDLGSNINAYSRGSDGGTPLHHAAKRGLLPTVKLLLARGANLYVRNDNGKTPLDVAIEEKKADIVRAIESTKPRKVIDLRREDIKEINFRGSDPSLIIYDKSNKTRYKFASGNPGDCQQIQLLYNACSLVGPTASEMTNGWMDEPSKEDYNGWAQLANSKFQHTETKVILPPSQNDLPTFSTARVHNELPTAIASVPSAPPLLDEVFYDDPIIRNPSQLFNSSDDTCCCVICWEMPVEAACVPCGHMATCMRCLNEVK